MEKTVEVSPFLQADALFLCSRNSRCCQIKNDRKGRERCIKRNKTGKEKRRLKGTGEKEVPMEM